ncbi:MAG: hypothetical protein AAF720_07015 [Pseudomonadota bacterium]
MSDIVFNKLRDQLSVEKLKAKVAELDGRSISHIFVGMLTISTVVLTVVTISLDAKSSNAAPIKPKQDVSFSGLSKNPITVAPNENNEAEVKDLPSAVFDGDVKKALKPAIEKFREGKYAIARDLAEPIAIRGNPVAQHLVGYLYETGLGGVSDRKAAENFYRRSAKAGYVDGQLSLGLFYLEGKKADVQPSLAFKWLNAAADQGDPRALSRLGALYIDGIGTDRDIKIGLSLFERAAALGDRDALFFLGYSAMHGKFGAPNYVRARSKLEAAMAAGHEEAAFNLALLHRSRAFPDANPDLALTIMNRAAEAGYAPAMTAMGLYAHKGEVPGKAADWFEKADKAGDLQGRFLHAVAIANGDGREKDVQRAVKMARSVARSSLADESLREEVVRFLIAQNAAETTTYGALRE